MIEAAHNPQGVRVHTTVRSIELSTKSSLHTQDHRERSLERPNGWIKSSTLCQFSQFLTPINALAIMH